MPGLNRPPPWPVPRTAGPPAPPPLSPPLPPFPDRRLTAPAAHGEGTVAAQPALAALSQVGARGRGGREARPGRVEDAAADSLAAGATALPPWPPVFWPRGCRRRRRGQCRTPPSPPAPPSPPMAWLDAIVLLEMESDPAALKIPPPWPSVPAEPLPPAPPNWPPRPLHRAVAFPSRRRHCSGWPPRKASPGRRSSRSTAPSPAARPCWIVTLEIDTLPPRTWKTRSRLLPSMMVLAELFPLMVRLPRDVEVSGRAGVLPGTGDRQREGAAGQDDGVGAALACRRPGWPSEARCGRWRPCRCSGSRPPCRASC